MKMGQVAIWTNDPEILREFYTTYFEGRSREKYTNSQKKFESYFVWFDKEGSTSLEIMRRPDIPQIEVSQEYIGITHIAFSIGAKRR